MAVTKVWVNENGEGHWDVTVGILSASCDANELKETIEELAELQQAA